VPVRREIVGVIDYLSQQSILSLINEVLKELPTSDKINLPAKYKIEP